MEQGGTAHLRLQPTFHPESECIFTIVPTIWRRFQKWSLCQLTSRRSPIAYLAIFTYAVDCVLIIAELDGVDFPIMCLPAHGALMLLHIWGENQYWTLLVLTQRPQEHKRSLLWRHKRPFVLLRSLWHSSKPAWGSPIHSQHPVPILPLSLWPQKSLSITTRLDRPAHTLHCQLEAFCIQVPLALLPLLSCPSSQLLTALSPQRPGTAASTCARSRFPIQR